MSAGVQLAVDGVFLSGLGGAELVELGQPGPDPSLYLGELVEQLAQLLVQHGQALFERGGALGDLSASGCDVHGVT